MKKTLITYLMIFYSGFLFAQNIEKNELFGNWIFVELQNDKGEKITEIPVSKLEKELGIKVEKVNRPDILLKENGEYEQKFTETNTDTGFWKLISKTNELNFELRISPNDKLLKYLKQVKIVRKSEDGFYYQNPIKDKILFYKKDSLVLSDDKPEYYRIYKRK